MRQDGDKERYGHGPFTFSSVWVELPATTGWFADAKENSIAVRTKKSLMMNTIIDEGGLYRLPLLKMEVDAPNLICENIFFFVFFCFDLR
jgi:hypothetical protein